MKRFRTRALLALVAMVFVAAACSNSDGTSSSSNTAGGGSSGTAASGDRNTNVPISGVPGVTDDSISYAVIGTKANNPLGTCILDCYAAGVQAYFDYQNAEFDGIYGRQLEIGEILDDELANNQARSIEVISGGKEFGVFVATLVAAGYGDLNDAGVPTYGWGIHATEVTGREGIFPSVPAPCADCTTRGGSYLLKQAGLTKVATLGYGVSENSKVCTGARRDAFEKYSDVTGADVVYFNDDLGFGLPNGIGPEVTAMKEAGVQFISTCMDLNGMKTLAQELQRQGMDNVVLDHPNTYNQAFVAEAGALFEGDYVTPGFRPFEATPNEAQQKFVEYMGKAGKELSELAMTGWINATVAVGGLLAAGPDFDRQSVIDATNLTADSAGGLIVPVDWTKQHVPATQDNPSAGGQYECISTVKVVSGKFVTVGDPSTPFICWPTASREWSEPEQLAFDE
jgi:hypothetical protein